MGFLSHVTILALLAHLGSAVTIRLYGSDSGCITSNWLQCGDVPSGACCSTGSRFRSARFLGLPTGGTPAQASVFQHAADRNCGTSCNMFVGGSGDDCLSCPYVDGARWTAPSLLLNSSSSDTSAAAAAAEEEEGSCDVEDEEKDCMRQLPDTLGLKDGRKFRVYYDVPESVTEELLELESDGEDVPEHLREYEIVE